MMKLRSITTLMAVGALAGLAACSSGADRQQTAMAAPPAAPPPAPAPAAAPAPTPGNELSPHMVRRVQTVLKRDGDYRGRVDGKWGPMTQNAVTQYQQENNLQPTGNLDEPTLMAMHMSAPGTPGGNESMGGAPGGMGGAPGGMGGGPAGTGGAPGGTGGAGTGGTSTTQ
jgi:peptidoglycan hydrolase-like protein with peptidoglycan-binding domain